MTIHSRKLALLSYHSVYPVAHAWIGSSLSTVDGVSFTFWYKDTAYEGQIDEPEEEDDTVITFPKKEFNAMRELIREIEPA